MKKLACVVILAVLSSCEQQPAFSQWQTPNHSVPIGRGAGTTGFGNVAPGAAGQPFVSSGAAVDPAFQVLPNSGLANMPASTAKCNNTGGSATPIDCTTAQLQTMLGFTPLPSVNTQTVNYTITSSDCSKTVQAGTGATGLITVTLPSVSGFPAGCTVLVVNGDGTRGKKLSGFPTPLPANNILWPTQSIGVQIINGAWATIYNPPRWLPSSIPTFNVDNSLGSDSNDGLAAGSGALATIGKCTALAYQAIDPAAVNQVVCSPLNGQTYQEFVAVFYPMGFGATLQINGNGGAFTWKPINSGYALQFGDGALVGLSNVSFLSTGVTTPQGLIFGHNFGVLDINAGVTVSGGVNTQNAITCDFDTHFNINNGLTVAGTFNSVFSSNGCKNATYAISNTLMFSGTPALAQLFTLLSNTKIALSGNVTFSGAVAAGMRKYFVSGNSTLDNASGNGNIPGSVAGVTQAGGQYCDGGTAPASPC